LITVTIVIDDALAPDAPQRGVGHARQDDRILDGDDRLIIIAIQRPGLQLALGQAA
jgi:hypothetical protein